jgi:cyclic pyranopterin phosphate synthase
MMQKEEIEQLASIFVNLGVKKIRLTGGEPLLRQDADAIIRSLARLPVTLTLTTNGTRLPEFIQVMKESNIRSINVSLDSLKTETFARITGRDHHRRIVDYIHLALQAGMKIKINVVVMKGINDHEINDFILWTRDTPIHVRFIEFMPFSGNHWSSAKVITWQQVLQEIGRMYPYTPLERKKHATEKKFRVPGHAGTFAVISPMSDPFCGDCNRMRLTADGKMKNCLFSTREVDLLTPLRRGDDIIPLIRQCVLEKAAQLGGQFNLGFNLVQAAQLKNRSMITIGG